MVRPFIESDIDDFMVYRNDLEWMRYQNFKGRSRQEYSNALLRDCTLSDGKQLAIVHKADNRLIGDLYIKQEDCTFWVGYAISPQYAKQGFAFEVVLVVLGALKTMGVKLVKACVARENAASIGLLEKLGFTCTEAGDDFVYSMNL